MAKLRRRSDREGRYELDYVDINGTRYRINTGTADVKIARLWLAKVEELLSLARIGQIPHVGRLTLADIQGKRRPPAERMRLATFATLYADRCRHDLELAASTIDLNTDALNSFIGVIGDRRLSEITSDEVRQWKRGLARAGKAKATVSIYQRALHAAFNRAVKWHYVDENPFAEIELPKSDKPRKAMTAEEVRRLLSAIKEDWFKTYIQFLLYTGCRRNEILFLKTEDIDTKRWVVAVVADKTGKRLDLPINRALQKVIDGMGLPKSGYVFPSQKIHGVPWYPDTVTHLFKRSLRRAGLPNAYSLHSLRHTYATFLREQGVPRDIVQKLLGHASPGTTDLYDHSEALYFRQWADLVDYETTT